MQYIQGIHNNYIVMSLMQKWIASYGLVSCMWLSGTALDS